LEEASRFIDSAGVGIGDNLFPNDLDGYLPVNTCIFRQVDFAHPAASQGAQEVIVPEVCSFE
jgi:hypothetical protein